MILNIKKKRNREEEELLLQMEITKIKIINNQKIRKKINQNKRNMMKVMKKKWILKIMIKVLVNCKLFKKKILRSSLRLNKALINNNIKKK